MKIAPHFLNYPYPLFPPIRIGIIVQNENPKFLNVWKLWISFVKFSETLPKYDA